ncbi:MAG: hypothetical protein CBC89_06255 [Euryarchaeota archaeon TMED129]|nr:MAG: hypothetical protein CBC89_06210 [Euryarchaeota archaeon TMED129]OUV63989.1 MAG: hypothetical protein CBC89_06255 [Euryarchaeota archaeon TMED129]|tara:strand:+ start:59 stop:319 length:261 start_codon:yes stop_codon:yes gene_type:complete
MKKLLTRLAVESHNQTYDNELIFEEVEEQLQDEIDFAVESLKEEIERVKERWIRRHRYTNEFLNLDSELIDSQDFAREVIKQVNGC